MWISNHATTQAAWEWVNETLVLKEKEVIKKGGVRYGPQVISYDHYMVINKAWVDPNFDFGKTFGYRKHKWSKLITNYVNLNYLELVKAQVQERELKKDNNYNIAMQFDNAHSSGHGCLLSLTFSRRTIQDNPILIFSLRSSEVTKRLLFDFLLIQRIGEYVYGENASLSVILYCPNVFLSAESFVMYNNYKPIKELLGGSLAIKNIDPKSYASRVWEIYTKFKNIDPSTVKYKVHLRSIKNIQKDKNGDSISGVASLFACKLKLLPQHVRDETEFAPLSSNGKAIRVK